MQRTTNKEPHWVQDTTNEPMDLEGGVACSEFSSSRFAPHGFLKEVLGSLASVCAVLHDVPKKKNKKKKKECIFLQPSAYDGEGTVWRLFSFDF